MSATEVEPEATAALFGQQIEVARAFTADLALRGEALGLIGPLEAARIWTRHVVNSVLLAPLLREGATVADVGSGAGLPGLVLAIARPDVSFTLIEPMERRVEWLNDQTRSLGLSNVIVTRARAQDCALSVSVDQVTARAVSALTSLLPVCVPLVVPGGELVLMKGAGVTREIEAAAKTIRRLRLHDVRVETLGEGIVDDPTRVFRARVDRGPAR
ncbi:MAG: hypothetical protein RI885_2252 [Actinomycetota bacterium]